MRLRDRWKRMKNRQAAPYAIRTSQKSDVGKREHQEDAIFVCADNKNPVNDQVIFGIVCDGMGGMENGAWAADTSLRYIKGRLMGEQYNPETNIPRLLSGAAMEADKKISELEHGMSGTTLVAAAISRDGLYWISVGDSRIYLLRRKADSLERLGRDHNGLMLLEQAREAGKITEADVKNYPQKEGLISFLGVGDLRLIDQNKQAVDMEDGDMVLLCSDGLTKVMTEKEITHVLREETDVSQLADRLVERALAKQDEHQDNISVGILAYEGGIE